MHAFWLVLTYDLLEDRRIDDVIILYYIKQIDSKLPCFCSVIDHRGRQNLVEQKNGTRGAVECVIQSSSDVNGIKKSKIRNATQTIEQITVAIFMFISSFSFFVK